MKCQSLEYVESNISHAHCMCKVCCCSTISCIQFIILFHSNRTKYRARGGVEQIICRFADPQDTGMKIINNVIIYYLHSHNDNRCSLFGQISVILNRLVNRLIQCYTHTHSDRAQVEPQSASEWRKHFQTHTCKQMLLNALLIIGT